MADFTQVATNEDIAAIADAIRYAEGSEDDMTIPAMPAKIRALKKTLIEKTITENGEYLPASDEADGYSKVYVSIPAPPLPPVEEIADLSGTKWLLNESLQWSFFNRYYALAFTINASGSDYAMSGLNFTSTMLAVYRGLYSSATQSIIANSFGFYISGSYQFETNREVLIAGGADATNQELVSWFKNNATLIGIIR